MCVGGRDPIGLRGRGVINVSLGHFHNPEKILNIPCLFLFVCLFELHSSKKKNNKFPTISFRTSKQSETEAEM